MYTYIYTLDCPIATETTTDIYKTAVKDFAVTPHWISILKASVIFGLTSESESDREIRCSIGKLAPLIGDGLHP